MRFERILITGAGGYLGGRLVARLAAAGGRSVLATDVRPIPEEQHRPGVEYRELDVRDPALGKVLAKHRSQVVIHLAAIVNPGPDSRRDFEYSVDVGGTENVLLACCENEVRRLVLTSSGAAYGYHPDNPCWLDEDDPLRGNREFAYAWHKRLVEERLAAARHEYPALEQVVLRLGTVLGETTRNQITNLFEKPRLLGIRGGDDRFVFVWDEDVAACLEHALDSPGAGVFNVAGDGALSMAELAHRMGKPYWRLPAWPVRLALALGKPLGLTRYGPEQVRFVQYRPVLANRRLKETFGFTPSKTSSEVFDLYWRHRATRPRA